MNVQIFTLCDAANVDTNGKINLLGAFDQLFAPSAPLTHPSCVLVVKMQFERIEDGNKAFKIAVVDADGKEVFPAVSGNLAIKTLPEVRTTSMQILGIIQMLTLPRFGEYAIDLAIDGLVVASIPLYARQIHPQQQLPQR